GARPCAGARMTARARIEEPTAEERLDVGARGGVDPLPARGTLRVVVGDHPLDDPLLDAQTIAARRALEAAAEPERQRLHALLATLELDAESAAEIAARQRGAVRGVNAADAVVRSIGAIAIRARVARAASTSACAPMASKERDDHHTREARESI